MTVRDLRMMYKRETGMLPNGSYLSMDGHPINAGFDKELSAYIEWLEHVAITQLTLTKKFIPWEPISKLTDEQIFNNHFKH